MIKWRVTYNTGGPRSIHVTGTFDTPTGETVELTSGAVVDSLYYAKPAAWRALAECVKAEVRLLAAEYLEGTPPEGMGGSHD
jgi:hypothetical protein